MLPTEAYQQFKEIYFKQFSVSLSDEEVVKKANDFIEMFKVLAQPDQKDIDTLERVSVK
ncbi:MAG: hypothetical protein UR29_C0003G0002 [Candidatus Woesebacteria bacterium GW2011_GWC2_33_12]|uniref:Uncharacterized protein n=1 Tax=Candidatus Woesebacteria bacterium GW2011_GWB1_33_22 TaxID=1618566 RepID=A0A0F9ZLG9_9BACT|nr:MAG: hypothetical protein UR29_C0003G0002 [Candidatus Woesebacteria bacterium GW2011_GWC2_33_12]KKP42243.1 MAG: hypothetical protein UR33_C0004G0002 [Candidatus Woesebacteria bacterium GW2011_GWA2_33_20]KKP44974.1 MAG: hypothetical protein UR35_C0004G0006 [Candidatus Woesebacteria bacterium GW2011_GWB1_33_22]KKP46823.1 MAG: hypothetical protein UR37_C0004G0002 [Microgenomates group bacterium GW2011_GWC1_33_28]KKP50695.1 MAG: hypothetical protein UR41_C0004G0006 [Candidatus Woesebacteria bact